MVEKTNKPNQKIQVQMGGLRAYSSGALITLSGYVNIYKCVIHYIPSRPP